MDTKTRLFLACCSLCIGAPVAHADFVTGQVVDSMGVGVPGVNLDATDVINGGQVSLFNDGTDLNGFFTTTIPAGIYVISFKPPPPPLTTHLVLEVQSIVVVGTVNLGILALPAGVALSGRVIDTTGFPVAGVDLDVEDKVLGVKLSLTGDHTDPFGDFSIAVPANDIELTMDTRNVGQMLASRAFDLSPTQNLDLGDVVLEPGLILCGVLLDPFMNPVMGADLDVLDSATSKKIFTPNDNTNCSGEFELVVPAGRWDIEFCPPNGALLVGTDIEGLVVNADADLGEVMLQAGVILTGTVTDGLGNPQAGVDIDVAHSMSGSSVVTCADDTNAAGVYSVVVPTGTFNVEFDPNFSLPLGFELETNVSVAGTTILDAVVPDCPFATNFGAGRAGTGGAVPHIANAGGAPRVKNKGWGFRLEDGLGNGWAALALSLKALPFPTNGGNQGRVAGFSLTQNPRILISLEPQVSAVFFVQLNGTPGAAGAGWADFDFPLPLEALLGVTIYGQYAVADPGAVGGLALSEGIKATVCR